MVLLCKVGRCRWGSCLQNSSLLFCIVSHLKLVGLSPKQRVKVSLSHREGLRTDRSADFLGGNSAVSLSLPYNSTLGEAPEQGW